MKMIQSVLRSTAGAVQHVLRALAEDGGEGEGEMVTKYTVENVDVYYWMTWTGAILAFVMAFGIGANDVANTFGTSVGAKSLKIWQACIVAAITEFAGCLLMGKNVTDTVRKGIVDPAAFEQNPQVLMLGMWCALAGAGSWLLIATHFSMPVSTTHSIIGAILGFGMCYGDAAATINWEKVALVIVSWVASPLLSGIVACFFFVSVRWAVLRREDSLKAAYRFYPVFLFVMIKGSARYKLNKLDIGLSIGISFGVAAVLTLITYFLLFRLVIMPRIDAYDEEVARQKWKVAYKPEAEAAQNSNVDIEDATTVESATGIAGDEAAGSEVSNRGYEIIQSKQLDDDEAEKRGCLSNCWHVYLNPTAMDDKVHAEMGGEAAKVNQDAEVFAPKTELLFSGVQVATASFDSFAHGANDTANAIGPLAAIIGVSACGCIEKKTETELWIIFLGAIGLVVGLLLLGWRVIRSVGLKLVRVTPSRGFTMELSSALAVIVASKLGIPVSTTHCQVGAEMGVGLLESGCSNGNCMKGVNWKLFAKVFLSWVLTLIFAGGVTALLFSMCLYSPGYFGNNSLDIKSWQEAVPVEE